MRKRTFTGVGDAGPLADGGVVRETRVVGKLIASGAHVSGAAREVRVLADDRHRRRRVRYGVDAGHYGRSGRVAVIQDAYNIDTVVLIHSDTGVLTLAFFNLADIDIL